MAALAEMNVEGLIQFLKSNVDSEEFEGVEARSAVLIVQFERRNDDLSRAVGLLEARDRQQGYRIDDMIELRDKINDGFAVLKEHEEEYPVANKRRALTIVCDVLRALDQGQDLLANRIRRFAEPNDDVEDPEIRERIRSIDRVLGDAHVRHLVAFLELEN